MFSDIYIKYIQICTATNNLVKDGEHQMVLVALYYPLQADDTVLLCSAQREHREKRSSSHIGLKLSHICGLPPCPCWAESLCCWGGHLRDNQITHRWYQFALQPLSRCYVRKIINFPLIPISPPPNSPCLRDDPKSIWKHIKQDFQNVLTARKYIIRQAASPQVTLHQEKHLAINNNINPL